MGDYIWNPNTGVKIGDIVSLQIQEPAQRISKGCVMNTTVNLEGKLSDAGGLPMFQ